MSLPRPRLAAPLIAFLPLSCHSSSSAPVEEVAPRSNMPAASVSPALRYPAALREAVVDDYHGTAVADPYRWLEDPDSPQTRRWVEEQVALTGSYLEGIPERGAIRARLAELWDYERFGLPEEESGRLFFTRNDGLQNQAVLVVLDPGAEEPRALLDPNAFSADGTVALAGSEPSRDGRFLAYGVADGGSDWNVWRVRDVESGADLADEVRWVKFSNAAWTADGQGFFYSRYDEPKAGEELQQANYFQKLYYHRLGTPQAQDVLIYERSDRKEWGFAGAVSDDGEHLLIQVWHGTDPKNRVFYADIPAGGIPSTPKPLAVVELIPEPDASYEFAGNDGPTFFFRTDLEAPRGKLIAIDVRAPARERWRTLVAESGDALTSASLVGERFFLSYLRDARSLVRVHALDGAHVRDVELPGIGTAEGFHGRRGDRETFFTFTSFTEPGTVWRHQVESGRNEVFRRPELRFDPSRYATEQVFYRSKDGTRVPMFLTYRKGARKDGSNPTLLYGYGGFNIPMTPAFGVSRLAWMEMGGLYAVACLRGGGEYGEDWHQAGTLARKQNVFDDFLAAAEHLAGERWTSKGKLAIHGGSNGGLLVGACVTQRPDLFGAALPAVGVLDMLRFHKFTIGWAWTSDYGCADDPAHFPFLRAYSPYHNLKEGTRYPPTLITTADHDDRVVPAHSFKFAAAMQHAQGGGEPVLIRIDVRAGHGAGKPTSKLIDQAADELAFLVRELGVSYPAQR